MEEEQNKISIAAPHYAVLQVRVMGYDTLHYGLEQAYAEDPHVLAQWIVSEMSEFYAKERSGNFKFEVALRLLLMLENIDIAEIEETLKNPESKKRNLAFYKTLLFGSIPKRKKKPSTEKEAIK